MKKIQGTWNGEYTINYGTEEEPDIQYFAFEIRIKGDYNAFRGRFIDQTLKTNNSEIQGFLEDDFISFIRTVNSETELFEFLSFEPRDNRVSEFNFFGNYSEEEQPFTGIWELIVDEVNENLQESGVEELRTGAWYIQKI